MMLPEGKAAVAAAACSLRGSSVCGGTFFPSWPLHHPCSMTTPTHPTYQLRSHTRQHQSCASCTTAWSRMVTLVDLDVQYPSPANCIATTTASIVAMHCAPSKKLTRRRFQDPTTSSRPQLHSPSISSVPHRCRRCLGKTVLISAVNERNDAAEQWVVISLG
ncbi:hypothetical protein DFJ73DRAFT_881551 [Zopfochytrium polystomum]|nr:hypothetical protein DFJ73DRAFT_881551 [Zopfochytrium polystomum]